MRAKKENKVYDIAETQKEAYLKEGYDIYDNAGNVLEYSPLKVISYNQYMKVKEELEMAKLESNSSANVELTKQVEELTKTNNLLTSEKEELTKANVELTKQVEKLTKQLEKVTENK